MSSQAVSWLCPPSFSRCSWSGGAAATALWSTARSLRAHAPTRTGFYEESHPRKFTRNPDTGSRLLGPRHRHVGRCRRTVERSQRHSLGACSLQFIQEVAETYADGAALRRADHALSSSSRSFWVMPATQEAYARAVDLAFPVLVHEHATTWGEWKEPTTDARYIVAHGTCPRLVREQRTGATYAVFYELQSAEDVHALEENLPCRSIVMVETKDWELIPVENLVSVAYQRQTSILVVVSTTGMAEAQLASLERGVHGVILATGSASAVESFASLRNRYQRLENSLVLDPAVVVDVREAGVGERVCLDTCSLLAFHEGFLVGSSASTLALVLSEAAQNPYVASRPFRVNAGAVHSYILVPDGSTKYLCELRAGDELLAVDARSGRSRSVTLGRAKIERRPLLLVQLSLHADGTGAAAGNKTESWSGDIAGNVIVQNAETVRFAMPTTSGTSSSQHGNVAVTSLNRGQHQVLVHRPARDSNGTIARHLGRPVQEFILEQ